MLNFFFTVATLLDAMYIGRASVTRGTGGGDASPIFESAGITSNFQENSGPKPLSFWFLVENIFILYFLPSEENPGFAAAWSPSPPFSSAWRSPCI